MKVLIKNLSLDFCIAFAYVYIFEIVFQLTIFLLPNNEIIRMIHGIWIMLSSSGLVVLSTYYMYEFIFSRNFYFYYTIKYSRHIVLVTMAVMFTLLNFIYYIIYNLSLDYEAILKIVSLLAYFAIIGFTLFISRSLLSNKIGKNVFLLTVLALVIGGSILFTVILNDILGEFMIGITSFESAKNIYASIMPIVLLAPGDEYFILSIYSLVFNLLLILLSTVGYFSIKKIKINW